MGQAQRARFQRGSIFKRHGAWHVRYLTTVDGKRVQRSQKLCDAERGVTKSDALLLAGPVLAKVNANTSESQSDMDITAFFDDIYLPFVEASMKPSTSRSYRQIYKTYLKAHWSGRTLQHYQTHEASTFLTGLATGDSPLGRATLAHVRSLMSGVFTHAMNRGRLTSNPISGVKILAKVTPPKPGDFYSLEETEGIVSALVEHPDAQALCGLCFYAALRPSEATGLQWGDVDLEQGVIHVRRAVVRGHVDVPKTPESIATLEMVTPLRVILGVWKQAVERKGPLNPTAWVFPNEFGGPLWSTKDIISRVIRPTVEKAGLTWKSLYAFRRGAASHIVQLTNGNAAAAAAVLRHKTMAVTMAHYIKLNQTALTTGLNALGQKALAATAGDAHATAGLNGGGK